MDHSISSLDLARPWRTATLIASTVAALELVLVLALALALLDGARDLPARDPAQATPKRTKVSRAPAAELARGETIVVVLNGNGVTGAAATTARRVERIGYRVGSVGNAGSSEYRRSLVMYRPGRRGEALRLARDLRVRLVAPVDGLRARDLGRAHVVLVVGR